MCVTFKSKYICVSFGFGKLLCVIFFIQDSLEKLNSIVWPRILELLEERIAGLSKGNE